MYVLIWGIIFAFAEFPLGALLSAIGQQKKNMVTRGVVMTVNVILNLILIPLYSFVGAAIAALISYALLTCMGVYWVNKYVKVNWKGLFKSLLKILTAGLVMGMVVFILRNDVHFTLLILLGMVIYAVLGVLLRIVKWDQLRFLMKSFGKSS